MKSNSHRITAVMIAALTAVAIMYSVTNSKKFTAKAEICPTKNPANFPKLAAANAPVKAIIYTDMRQLHATLADLTIEQRKAIFRVLTPVQRTEVWLVHVGWFRNNVNKSLTASQVQFLDDVETILRNPNLTEADIPQNIIPRAIAVFGSKQFAYEAIGRLGGVTPGVQKFNYTHPAFPKAGFTSCTCAGSSDWCYGNVRSSDCKCARGGCDGSADGCGTLWWSACNGTCYGSAC